MNKIVLVIFILISTFSWTQNDKLSKTEKDSLDEIASQTAFKDSIVFESGDNIVGKIKQLDRGILKVKTKYSKSDFQIKWLKVKEIYSDRNYTIYLSSGQEIFGKIQMDRKDKRFAYIIQENNLKRPIVFKDIIFIKRIDKKFWDRLKANIDAGYTWTKANNQHQISVQAGLTYYGRKFQFGGNTNIVRSYQDSATTIKRTEGTFDIQVYMPHDFFYFLHNNLLSNTEQLIQLRSGTSTGFGYYYVSDNRMKGHVSLGVTWNNERFSNDTINRNSLEGFIGFKYEIFNLGDINIETYVNTMPSLSDLGRIRVDLKAYARYKFPFDMYIGASFTLNYDNRPTQDASPIDYVLQTSIGWTW